MLNRLKYSSLITGNSIAGIHIDIDSDDRCLAQLVLLRKNRSKLLVDKKKDKISDLESLVKSLSKNTPVSLSIDGKGIIYKKVSLTGDEDELSLLHKLMPNAGTDDFFVQRHMITENQGFVSAIRNETLENILKIFGRHKIFVTRFTAGPFDLNHIAGLLKDNPKEIHCENKIYLLENGSLSGCSTNGGDHFPKLFRAGDEEILESYIVAFAGAVAYFANPDPGLPEQIIAAKEEFCYKRLFLVTRWAMAVFLFLLLFSNYMLFEKYDKKNGELTFKVSQNKGLLNKLDTLAADLKMKEDFIARNDFLKSNSQSYYADRIAGTVPNAIILTTMDMQPLEKKLKDGDRPEFTRHIIRISGMSKNSVAFNEWIKDLNSCDWLKEVEVVNYAQEDEFSAGIFEVYISTGISTDQITENNVR